MMMIYTGQFANQHNRQLHCAPQINAVSSTEEQFLGRGKENNCCSVFTRRAPGLLAQQQKQLRFLTWDIALDKCA